MENKCHIEVHFIITITFPSFLSSSETRQFVIYNLETDRDGCAGINERNLFRCCPDTEHYFTVRRLVNVMPTDSTRRFIFKHRAYATDFQLRRGNLFEVDSHSPPPATVLGTTHSLSINLVPWEGWFVNVMQNRRETHGKLLAVTPTIRKEGWRRSSPEKSKEKHFSLQIIVE